MVLPDPTIVSRGCAVPRNPEPPHQRLHATSFTFSVRAGRFYNPAREKCVVVLQ